MNENENEVIDSQIDTEETVTDEGIVLEDEPIDDPEALKKEIATLKAQKDHWKKKATTTKPVEAVKAGDTKADSNLSTKDLYALMEAKVAEEDIADVEEFAGFKKISVSEALKNLTIKTLLREKAEQRNVANATNTGNARRSTSKVSDEDIISNASNGKLPEDPTALAEARMRARKNK